MKRFPCLVLWALVACGPAALAAPDEQTDGTRPAPAPETRAEEWAQKRSEKAKRVTPYHQGKVEQGILWFETKGIQLLNYRIFGFRPRFGGLPTGAGMALGTDYQMPGSGETRPTIEGSALWSFRGYQRYDLQLGKVRRSNRGALAYADFQYRNYPQEDFFGIGPASRRQDRTDFRLEDVSYDGVIGYQLHRRVRTDLRFGYLRVNTGPGTDDRFPDTRDRFSDVSAPGLALQPDFFRLVYSAVADATDSPANPHSGGKVAFSYSRFDDLDRSQYNFDRLALDARYYVPLGSTIRVLALRFFTSLDDARNDGRVPFYMQQTLGGGESLRGFREYRFRDANVLHLSGEYRWEPVRAIELALFYDAGKVFAQHNDFDFQGLRKSAGIGVRFKSPGGVVLRIDMARSGEGKRLYFKFGPSF